MPAITNLEVFGQIPAQMLWREAALDQISAFDKAAAAFAAKHRATVKIVGTHRSKSIDLPVIKLSTDVGEFTLRDNFHDINLMAILRAPATLSLAQLFAGVQEPLTWGWYLAEIKRARGYSWREWTDEEIADPRILRVRPVDSARWWEKTGEEKDRWAARMTDPAWYGQDWSSGELTWDGVLGPGVKLFRQGYAYAEGIDVPAAMDRKYTKGVSDFIIATDTLASAITMIERLHATT